MAIHLLFGETSNRLAGRTPFYAPGRCPAVAPRLQAKNTFGNENNNDELKNDLMREKMAYRMIKKEQI